MKFPKVITVACEKGGVGKTTIATNLAVYLKAMREDMPVTIFSFDNHFTVDRMFSLERKTPENSVEGIFDGKSIMNLVLLGQYGVNFIPSSRSLDFTSDDYDLLSVKLCESALQGVVIIDTRPTLDFFTKSALLASDIIIVPIKDLPSINNIKGLIDFCEATNNPVPGLKLVPSIVDGMVKFRNNTITMDEFLRSVAIERGYELFDTSIPKSPKVESLGTNLTFQTYPIINYAKNTLVHKNFSLFTKEILAMMDDIAEPKALNIYRARLFDSPDVENKRYRQLMENVIPYCPLCSEEILSKSLNVKPDMLYFESGNHKKGFLDVGCFINDVIGEFVMDVSDFDRFREIIIKEIDEDALLCINVVKIVPDDPADRIIISLYDENGDPIISAMTKVPFESKLSGIFSLIMENTPIGPSPCFVKFGDSFFPDGTLLAGNYRRFTQLKDKIVSSTTQSDRLPVTTPVTGTD